MPKKRSILKGLKIREVSVCPVGMHKGARIELFKADAGRHTHVPDPITKGAASAEEEDMGKIDMTKIPESLRQLVADAVSKAEKWDELQAAPKPIDKAGLAPEVVAALDKAEADAKAAHDRLAVLEKADRERVIVVKVDSLGDDIVIEREKMIEVLTKAQDAGILDPIVDAFKAQATALGEARKSLLAENGSSRPSGGSGTAFGELVAKASEIQKAEPKLTKEQALDRAMQANPDLYQRYLAEHPAQTGRSH